MIGWLVVGVLWLLGAVITAAWREAENGFAAAHNAAPIPTWQGWLVAVLWPFFAIWIAGTYVSDRLRRS